MNKFEIFNNIKERLHNQLRIHWNWIRQQEDYEEAFNLMEAWINQVANKDELDDCLTKKQGCGRKFKMFKDNQSYVHCGYIENILCPECEKSTKDTKDGGFAEKQK